MQQEGYDAHDFGLFDDRAALLWRKPYIDGAVRELTGADNRAVEDVRRSVEEMIIQAHDKSPQVMITSNQANKSRGNVRVTSTWTNKINFSRTSGEILVSTNKSEGQMKQEHIPLDPSLRCSDAVEFETELRKRVIGQEEAVRSYKPYNVSWPVSTIHSSCGQRSVARSYWNG